MKLALISDIHVRDTGLDQTINALEAIPAAINEHDVDACVCLGDLIIEKNRETDTKRIDNVIDVLSNVEANVFYTPGNHDRVHLTKEHLTQYLPNPPTHFDQQHGLLLIDTTTEKLDGVQGYITHEQRQYVDDILSNANQPVTICTHHPVSYIDLSDNPWFSTEPERGLTVNKRQMQNILASYGNTINAVISGHIHARHTTTGRAGIPQHTITPFNRETPQSVDPTGVFAIYDTEEQELDEYSVL